MDKVDAILDRIEEVEENYHDLRDAGEYSAALSIQQDLADLYHSLEMAA